MKKLNKSELEALAEKIVKDLSLKNEEYVEEFHESNKAIYRNIAETILQELNCLSIYTEEFLLSCMGYNKTKENTFSHKTVMGWIKQDKQKKIAYPYEAALGYHYKQEVINKLILAQIEADDLQSLIASVSESFKRKDS